MISQFRLKLNAALVALVHHVAVAIETRNAQSRTAAYLHGLSARMADAARDNPGF